MKIALSVLFTTAIVIVLCFYFISLNSKEEDTDNFALFIPAFIDSEQCIPIAPSVGPSQQMFFGNCVNPQQNTPVPTTTVFPTEIPTLTPVPVTATPSTSKFPGNGIIDKPGTYSGSIKSSNGDCLEVVADNVTIINSEIGPCNGRGIYFHNANNLLISNSTIDNNANGPQPCCERYTTVYTLNVNGLIIENSTLARGETLIELYNAVNIRIENNIGVNPLGPFPRGQFLQTQGSTSGVEFINNTLICDPSNNCEMEDAVSLYQGNNIKIIDNYLDSGQGLGRGSGCGIITESVSDVEISGNQVLNQYFAPDGGCGIGIASGQNILVENNYATGYGNIAYYVWHIGGGDCKNITLQNNAYGRRPNGSTNAYWNGGGCNNVAASGFILK